MPSCRAEQGIPWEIRGHLHSRCYLFARLAIAVRAVLVGDSLSPRTRRPFALRHAAVALLAVSAVVVMLLTTGQMADLRVALPPLSRALAWLEQLPVPLDMHHVAFFALVALGWRLLLPRARWWRLLLGLCGLAIGTELLQFGTTGRTPALLDARDDVIGSGIGLLLGSLPLWWASRRHV